jgi:glycosyltransferase involved in cell wall biosynthesis
MHLFINALAASAGGGLTYIRNVIPEMAERPGLQVTIVAAAGLRGEFRDLAHVEFVELEVSGARRWWYEQFQLAKAIRRTHADVLLSAGNFAMRSSPVPQILLSRNSLYTSADFYRDLRERREYGIWIDTHLRARLARKSVAWADVTVAPSEAFASELRRWTGGSHILAIHHGFDRESFIRDEGPLSAELLEKLRPTERAVRLLFVSHYNYYRNFETLIRSLPLLRDRLRDRLPNRKVKLLLTCKLVPGANPGPYRPEAAAQLIRDLGVAEMVVELGALPYHQLHQLYRLADLYVTPAYAETFAHPLVEAMSSGLLVIASDIPVHREICGDAAVYFPRFSADGLADRVAALITTADLMPGLSEKGRARSAAFSWKRHVDELLAVADSLVLGRPATALDRLAASN